MNGSLLDAVDQERRAVLYETRPVAYFFDMNDLIKSCTSLDSSDLIMLRLLNSASSRA